MTGTEKLIADLRHHADVIEKGVRSDVTALSEIKVMRQAAHYIERGYLDEETDSKK